MKKLTLLICIMLLSTACFAQWISLNSGTNYDLFSVYFTSSSTGYVSGVGGTILKTSNAGTTWTTQTSGTAAFLNSVYFTDPNTGYIVGTYPYTVAPGMTTILKTTNGGTTWIEQTNAITTSLHSVYFPDANTGYAVGDNGLIIKTTNAGTNWTVLSSGTTSQLFSVFFTSVDTGYVVGYSDTIFKTSNGGTTWIGQPSGLTNNPLSSVFFTDANTGYIGGDTILKTTNGGNNWTALSAYGGPIHFANANTGYAISGLNILKTNNAGSSWIAQPNGTLYGMKSIFATSADTAYAVGMLGTILKTNGCSLNVTATVTNATCDTCHNGSATGHVANGSPPFTWTWYTSPMQTTQAATGMAPGTYTLCVTDASGCVACNNSIFIDSTNCNGYSIDAFATNATCSTCYDGKAWVNITGGTPPYSYTWYTIPMQTTDTATGLPHGTYHVCVTDVNGCTTCDSVTVSTGNCSAHFYLYPDTSLAHHYFVVNMTSGVPPFSYYWEWGDGTHDTTALPSHTYSNAGFYTICLTITDFVGCVNMHCDSFYLMKNTNTMVYVDVISQTGITESSVKKSFLIYPNPAQDRVTITNTGTQKQTLVIIFNLQGQQMISAQFQNTIDLDVSALAKGIYLVKIQNENGVENKKLVIQ